MNTEMGLLEILKKEDRALSDMRLYGRILMDERAKQMNTSDDLIKSFYEESCNHYIDLRDKALEELNEAREDLREYFNALLKPDEKMKKKEGIYAALLRYKD